MSEGCWHEVERRREIAREQFFKAVTEARARKYEKDRRILDAEARGELS